MFVPSLGVPLVLALGCVTQAAVISRDQASFSDTNAVTAVSAKTLSNLAYIEQYAAAAYLPENNGGNPHATNKVVVCSTGTCPDVSGNMAPIAYKFHEVGPHNLTGFIALDHVKGIAVLAYRGSSLSLQDDVNSLGSYRMVNWQTLKSACPTCGVADQLYAGRNDTRDDIDNVFLRIIANSDLEPVITGHGLGAAHAAVAATELRVRNGTSTALYTYGQPRIGNNATTNLISSTPLQGGANYGGNYRVTHLNDPIPDLPPYYAGGNTPKPLCKRPAPYPANANDWTHSSPEYHIRVGDSGILAKNIDTFTGPLNCSGNSGLVTLPVDPANFCAKANCTANAHYFGCTYGCTA